MKKRMRNADATAPKAIFVQDLFDDGTLVSLARAAPQGLDSFRRSVRELSPGLSCCAIRRALVTRSWASSIGWYSE